MGRHMGIETQASLCTGEYRKKQEIKGPKQLQIYFPEWRAPGA